MTPDSTEYGTNGTEGLRDMSARRSKAGPFAALVGSFAAGALTVALFGPHGGTGTPTAGPTVTAPAVTQTAVVQAPRDTTADVVVEQQRAQLATIMGPYLAANPGATIAQLLADPGIRAMLDNHKPGAAQVQALADAVARADSGASSTATPTTAAQGQAAPTPTEDPAVALKAKADELHSILVGATGYAGYPEPGSLLAAVNGPLRAAIVKASTPGWCTVPPVRQYTNVGLPKPLGPPTRVRCGDGPSLAHVQALAAAVDAGVK